MLEDFSLIYTNLLKACIGTGILAYPSIVSRYGIFPASLFTFVAAAASMNGCFIYIDLNDSRGRNRTMATVADRLPKVFPLLVSLILVIKCYITTLVYVDVMDGIIEILTPDSLSYKQLVKAGILLLICLSLVLAIIMNDIKSLKLLSFIGLAGVAVLFSGALYNMNRGGTITPPLTTGRYNVIRDIGFFVFSFNCHHALFSICNASKVSALRIKIYVALVHLSASLIYLAFGWINCTFLPHPPIRVFDEWPAGPVLNIILVFYGLIVCASVVLQVYPMGEHVKSITNGSVSLNKTILCTILSSFVLKSLRVTSFSTVIKLISNPFSTLMSFIFPGLFLIYEKGNHSVLLKLCKVSFALTFGIMSFASIFVSVFGK